MGHHILRVPWAANRTKVVAMRPDIFDAISAIKISTPTASPPSKIPWRGYIQAGKGPWFVSGPTRLPRTREGDIQRDQNAFPSMVYHEADPDEGWVYTLARGRDDGASHLRVP